ncbi:MAG: peptidoglycan editing factor PgeF [Rhodothermales bacterium]
MTSSELAPIRPAVFDGVPGLVAGFSTRQGGVSRPPFEALNLGLSTGDERADVLENRRRLAEHVGFRPDALAIAGQVHGAEVKRVDAPGLFPGYDGLVTRTKGLLLCISAADCAAVLLADAEAGVVGACHAGWRGTVARIVEKTIEGMETEGGRPERLRAYVSPCISRDHFEVGPEVAAQFDAAFVHQTSDEEKPHVDLKAALRDQLRQAGVPAHAIEVARPCTFAEPASFFSYRAQAGRTGRMMGFIGLREGERESG